jgi:hypothetical protein
MEICPVSNTFELYERNNRSKECPIHYFLDFVFAHGINQNKYTTRKKNILLVLLQLIDDFDFVCTVFLCLVALSICSTNLSAIFPYVLVNFNYINDACIIAFLHSINVCVAFLKIQAYMHVFSHEYKLGEP